MRQTLLLILLFLGLALARVPGQVTIVPYPTVITADVCVYGGTSGGTIAAVQAARMGKSVALIVVNNHLGGMTSGGLGETDIGNNGNTYIQGVAREFYTRVGQKYNSSTAQFTFEPHVAEAVFDEMAQSAGVVLYENEQLASVTKAGAQITQLAMVDGTLFRAQVFIDASYEGDLMAAAGVSYTIGREANSQYGETYDGTRAPNTGGHQFGSLNVDPYVTPGDPASGLIPLVQTGTPGTPGNADSLVQSYNYRVCLTKTATNMIPIGPPPGYDPANYELLARFVQAQVAAGTTLSLGSLMTVSSMPNGKTDINNNGAVSTDFVGQADTYPTASYATRAQIATAHQNYTLGFFYFLATDPRIPAAVQTAMQSYGLCKDEFTDNGGFSNQLYVREARRMVSDYVMTQANCTGATVAANSIGLASYTMDSHNAERVVISGYTQNEGDCEMGVSQPYPVSYGALVPKAAQCTNLLVPWSISASHTGFASIRLEPVFMILGQSAGTAACFAIDDGVTVQNVSYPKLQAELLADGQMLTWTTSGSSNPGIVVDNADATGITINGAWTVSTSTAGYYGPNYLHDGDTGGTLPVKSVQFTPTLPSAGTYQVFLHWTAYTNRATAVPVDIVSTTGTTTVTVNQQTDGGEWNLLGTFSFNAGTTGSVTVRNTNANGYVIADAAGFTSTVALPIVSLWAGDADAAKPLSMTGTAQNGWFVVSRTGVTTSALTVNLTIGGTATGGSDYTSIPSSIVIPSGASSAIVTVTPLAGETPEGPVTVVANVAANAAYAIGTLNSATVTIQDRPFYSWLHSVFTPAQLANTTGDPTGDDADPYGIGVPNLLEFLAGRNPNIPAAGSITTEGYTQIGSENYLTLTYTRLDAATDVTPTVEVCDDLSTWTSGTSAVQQTIVNDNGVMQTIIARDLTPMQGAGRRFIRLRASRAQ